MWPGTRMFTTPWEAARIGKWQWHAKRCREIALTMSANGQVARAKEFEEAADLADKISSEEAENMAKFHSARRSRLRDDFE